VRVGTGTLARDALEQALSLDSRFGRTFAGLLFRPGRVTAEYLDGRRVRYSSPVNLYLLASFLFFLAEALVPEGPASVRLQMNQARLELQRDLEEAQRDAPPEERAVLQEVERAVAPGSSARGGGTGAPGAPAGRGHGLAEAEAWLRGRTWPGPALAERVHLARQLPPGEALRRMRTAFAQNAPKVLFFLVPVMALCLKLLWRRRFYAEHLVFSLHAQSLTYLALLPGVFLPALSGPGFLASVGWSALALRRVYGGSWGAVLGKGAVVFVAVALALGLGLTVTAAVAFVAM